jgi:phage gp29-like protein
MVTKILDQFGRPLVVEQLHEPQTSQLGQLHHEVQSHPSRGLTPSRLAQILEAAEQGDLVAQYELFEDMEEKDGHIAAEMGKRRRAVTQLPWKIVPPDGADAKEKRAAEELAELVQQVEDLEEGFFDATDATGKGLSNLEMEWHRPEKQWIPATLTHRPATWFQLKRGKRQELRLRDNTAEGAELWPFGWITHRQKAKSGYLERASLFRVLVWPYLFKNYSIADLAEFLEIYGIPVRLGKYPPGAGEKEKATLLRALVNIGHNAAGIIPNGMELDFKDAATGDPDAFMAMIDWCERTQSKVILGATLTSQADRGSNTNALGNVHNEVRQDLRDADARMLGSTLTRDLVYPIGVLNGLIEPSMRRCPRFVLDTSQPEDMKAFADSLPALAKAGLRIRRSWAHEKLGIPEAAEGEPILEAAAPPPPLAPAEDADASGAADVVPIGRKPPKRSPLAAATFQTVQDAPALMAANFNRYPGGAAAWVEQLRDLVNTAGSLEEIRDALVERYPDMTLDEYAASLAQALAAARLAGRAEVLQDIEET